MCRICSHFSFNENKINKMFVSLVCLTLTKYTLGLLLIISIKKNVKRMSKGCDSNF